jgi:hypothetical protein
MIKYLAPSQLLLAQKKFYYKYHEHKDESVFMASPSPDFLNPRAYNLCELCGRLKAIEIDKTIEKEIQEVIDKKKRAAIS